jgi:hypothetical protein
MPLASDDKAPPVVANGTSISTDTLAPVCAGLAGKVNAFLEETGGGELLERVRGQTRVALGVIEKALGMYRLVSLFAICSGKKDFILIVRKPR